MIDKSIHAMIPPNDLPSTLYTSIVEYVQTLLRDCPAYKDEYWYKCNWMPFIVQADFARDDLDQSLEAHLVLVECVCDARPNVEIFYERLMQVIPFLRQYALTETSEMWDWKEFTGEIGLRAQGHLTALVMKTRR